MTISSLVIGSSTEEFWTAIKNEDYQKAAEVGKIIGKTIPEYYYLAGICFQNISCYEEYAVYRNNYLQLGNPIKLREILLEQEIQNPDSPQILLLKGIIAELYPELGLGISKEFLEQAKSQLEANPYVFNYLGFHEMNNSNYSEVARKHIEQAIILKPDLPEAYNNLAVILNYNQQPEKALNMLFISLKKCPNNPVNIYYNIIGLKAFEVVLVISPCDGGGGTYSISTPGLDVAFRERLKQEFKDTPIHLLKLAECFVKWNNPKEAEALLEGAHIDQNSILNKYINFRIQNLYGNYDEMVVLAQEILASKDLDYQRLFECGNILFHMEEFDLANAFYEASLTNVNPDDFLYLLKIYSNLGASNYCLQDEETAILYFEKALNYNPSDLITLENLGLAYRNKGDKVKAREYFIKVLEYTDDSRTQERVNIYLEQLDD
jgi:tetratricopeptide (TPR) repeat protein